MSKSTKTIAGDRHIIAGENNGRFFKFKVAEKFYQVNTNNFHTVLISTAVRVGTFLCVTAPGWGRGGIDDS